MQTFIRVAVTGVLAGLALLVPAPVAAAADCCEVTFQAFVEQNGNATARCGKGESYLTVKYGGGYKVFARLGYGDFDNYDDYNDLRDESHYFSGALTDTRNADGSYIYTSDAANLGIATDSYQTLGIAVHDKDTGDRLWSGLWNLSVICGNDYTIVIND